MACANCYDYNDFAAQVQREIVAYGVDRFYNDLQNRTVGRPPRGLTGEAFTVFNNYWPKGSDGKPDVVLFEKCRGLVPFRIFLARLGYDNPDFVWRDRKWSGGRVVAGGLAVQPIEKYIQFKLDPFSDPAKGSQSSLFLLLHRLRAIAEKRLKQYASIWNNAIFGGCPASGVSLLAAPERLTGFPTWPKIPDGRPDAFIAAATGTSAIAAAAAGRTNWSAIIQKAKDFGFEDVGELLGSPPTHRIAKTLVTYAVWPTDKRLICGGARPTPFWPLELAAQKSFWQLVLLEERTSEDVGNKFWGWLVNNFGSRGADLPEPVLQLLVHKKRLYAPKLNVMLEKVILDSPATFSGTGYDSSAVAGAMRSAKDIIGNAGFLGTSTFINKYGWVPLSPFVLTNDEIRENNERAKLFEGTVRQLLVEGASQTIAALPEWGDFAENLIGTPQTQEAVAISRPDQPPPRAPRPAQEQSLIALPPRSLRKMPTWKKLVIALSVGGAGLLGLYYVASRRQKGKA